MKRVETLGVFGSGKTTLAKRIAGQDVVVLAERHEENRWWGNALNERVGHLAYDLTFLLQHLYLAVEDDSVAAHSIAICDWSFLSDRLWASRRLGDEFGAYESVHATLLRRVEPALGYLYLRQSVDVIVERIVRRGRKPEMAYLDGVAAAAAGLEMLVDSLPKDKVAVIDDHVRSEEVRALARKWMEVGA